MAKIQFFCNSGANIHSCRRSAILDTKKDLNFDDDEWESMSNEDKTKLAVEWAQERLEIYFEEP